nr:MAG TPA: hypothetical protein [Bacteriophage sp.]
MVVYIRVVRCIVNGITTARKPFSLRAEFYNTLF